MRDSWTLMAVGQAKGVKDFCLDELERRLKLQTPQVKEELDVTLSKMREEILEVLMLRVRASG